MREYAVITGAAIVIAIIAFWAVNTRVAKAPGGTTACTQEAKICPDGSAVGRTGPNCEFAACPEATVTSTTEGGSDSILPYASGVRGVVMLGPTCPVMQEPPDPMCADKPYATSVLVYRAGAKTPFVIGNSDKDGTFSFSLPPGSYTLAAGSDKPLPRCAGAAITVPADGYVSTTISCDTGIR